MVLVRRSEWTPFHNAPFHNAVRQWDRDFDAIARRVFGNNADGGFVPAADIERDGSDVVVKLELPGVDVASDVEVEVSDGRLIVKGERNSESTRGGEEGQAVLVREIRSGSFRREFDLPDHVTADQVEAGYDRGVLTVRVRDISRPVSGPTKVQIRGGATPEESPGESV